MIRSTASRCASSCRRAGPHQSASSRKLPCILSKRPVMMLSSTVMPLKSATFWNVLATPSAATSGGVKWVRSRPSNAIRPSYGR